MAKDPAFLFYPGDYLRDTQTLSSNSQVAYDRIMCEHMRNICISKQQLKFFTKRLTDDEINEIMFVLTEIEGGYQIEWIAESIAKRRKYSDSRRNNRKGKTKEDINNISKSYDSHMENENENENVEEDKHKKEKFDFKKSLMSLGVEKEIISDWLLVRKNKKAANTETALKSIKKQIELSDKSANECIKIAAENSWAGFKAEWLINKDPIKTSKNGQSWEGLKELSNLTFPDDDK